MRKLIPGLAVAALGALAALTPVVQAQATTPHRCISITHTTLAGVTASGGGVATLHADGLIMSTPTTPAKVSYRKVLPAPVPMEHVTGLRYTTDRQDGATGVESTVAAYKLGIDANGDNTVDGVLVYEPYYNTTVTAEQQTHDALGADRGGKWWYSAEPGNKQTLATFAAWQAGTGPVAFPAPEVRWIGVEQGTWNAGAITLVSKVLFRTKGYCKKITWAKPVATTPPTTVPPTTNPPTTQPTTRPPTSQPPTSSAPPQPEPEPSDPQPSETAPPLVSGGAGGDDALPVTGPAMVGLGVAGLALVAAGAAALVITRRRRARFTA